MTDNETRWIPTSYDMIEQIFKVIEPLLRRDEPKGIYDELLFDFGAGDGRVVDCFDNHYPVAVPANGIEKALDDMPVQSTALWCGDFLKDPINGMKDITIAFISLADMETYMKLMARLMEECPKLRIIITNIQYEPLKDKLWKVIEPPRLQSHLLQLHGDLELLKTHTLGEILADTTRQIYGKVDTEIEADFHFYIYVK